jgi:glycosyltransferase involved in cell wall biosynthesis
MKFSIVVPIYNDGALAADFCRSAETTFRKYLGKDDITDDFEIVFVDDGSKNDSPRILREVCDEFPFARTAVLMRNFGQHIAISAGYRFARGEYVGMMNVDQEDPLDQVPLILDELLKGSWDIVGGIYERRDVPLLNRVTSYLFNVMLNRLTGYDSPLNAATVRFMTRRSLDAYNSLTERSRFIPGLEMWLGFRYRHIPVQHRARKVGKSSYNFRRRMRMAMASIISFSDFPLRLAVKFGLLVAGAGLLFSLAVICDQLFFRSVLPGYTSTLAAIVLLGGVQISVTGVASLYVGRVLAEVQGRPLFLVRETYGDLPSADALAGAPSRPLPSLHVS